MKPPLLARLEQHERLLIAGAGGGFDVYAGLPLFFAMRAAGKQAFLGNLTFTYLGGTEARFVGPHLVAWRGQRRDPNSQRQRRTA